MVVRRTISPRKMGDISYGICSRSPAIHAFGSWLPVSSVSWPDLLGSQLCLFNTLDSLGVVCALAIGELALPGGAIVVGVDGRLLLPSLLPPRLLGLLRAEP